MTVRWEGMNAELRERLDRLLTEGGPAFVVNSAVRTRAEQERLYAIFLRDGWPTAAKPGTSKHERGLAVDVEGPEQERYRLIRKYGFHRPVPGEKWHFELSPNRKPLEATPVPPAPPEDEEMLDPKREVHAVKCPEQLVPGVTPGRIGRWILHADGGIDAEDTDIFYGSYWSLPEKARLGGPRTFHTIEPLGPRNADGYVIYGSGKSWYAFTAKLWEEIRPR